MEIFNLFNDIAKHPECYSTVMDMRTIFFNPPFSYDTALTHLKRTPSKGRTRGVCNGQPRWRKNFEKFQSNSFYHDRVVERMPEKFKRRQRISTQNREPANRKKKQNCNRQKARFASANLCKADFRQI